MRTDVLIRMQASSEKGHSKAMQIAAAFAGVESVTLSGEGRNLLRVVGEGVDSSDLITKLQAGRGYASTSAVGGGGYHSAHAGALGDSAIYGQYSGYPAASYSPAAAADKYYRYQQPSYEYYQPPQYPTTVVLHEYPTGDPTGCSVM
ncbi:unnamed protein product [Alopecurus aequalis]